MQNLQSCERQIDYDLDWHSPPREQLHSVPGWGSDLDRKNRPAVPMERTPRRFIHVPEEQPVRQAQSVEVFCSPERPGAIRRLACKLPENDLRHGHVPNVLAEMGIRSDLRRNPAGLVRKALIATAVAGGIVALCNRHRRY